MSRPVRPRLFLAIMVCVAASVASAQERTTRAKPITAGSVTLNPYHVVAVFRPVDQRSVAVLVAKPGQNLQTILIKDYRDAATVFSEIWGNEQVTKDPGEVDASRPLTRMMLKEAEGKTPTLIVNVDRVLAIAYDANRRSAAIYLDRLDPFIPLVDPNTNDELDHLVIQNIRDEADVVVAAYKACIVTAR